MCRRTSRIRRSTQTTMSPYPACSCAAVRNPWWSIWTFPVAEQPERCIGGRHNPSRAQALSLQAWGSRVVSAAFAIDHEPAPPWWRVSHSTTLPRPDLIVLRRALLSSTRFAFEARVGSRCQALPGQTTATLAISSCSLRSACARFLLQGWRNSCAVIDRPRRPC